MFKKISSKIIIALVFFFMWIIIFPLLNSVFASDLLSDAFSAAKGYDTVLNFWWNKDDVGSNLLNPSTQVNLWWWDLLEKRDSLLVRWSKFLLRITIALSISMIIYNWIKYMIEVSQWKDALGTEAQKHILYIVLWLLVALSSVAIINLLTSAAYTVWGMSLDDVILEQQ